LRLLGVAVLRFRTFSTGNPILDAAGETFNVARGSVGVTFRF
jgi:hypothetical protein